MNYLFESPEQTIERIQSETHVDERYDDEDVCEYCEGDGFLVCDKDDGEGHMMRGVGEEKCICSIEVEAEL